MTEVQQETVHFSGRVQGVGFRYTVLQLAKEFEVTGYVKNISDGRVLLEMEGTLAEITAYLDAIEEQMAGYIRLTERASTRGISRFTTFEIR